MLGLQCTNSSSMETWTGQVRSWNGSFLCWFGFRHDASSVGASVASAAAAVAGKHSFCEGQTTVQQCVLLHHITSKICSSSAPQTARSCAAVSACERPTHDTTVRYAPTGQRVQGTKPTPTELLPMGEPGEPALQSQQVLVLPCYLLTGSFQLTEDDDLHLREQHANFRMGAGQRLQRPSTHASGRAPSGPLSPAAASAAAAAAAGGAAAAIASKKTRRRWLEDENDSLGGGDDFIPVGRQDQAANTGHIVRMRRGEAWSKFLAYEGCCQVS